MSETPFNHAKAVREMVQDLAGEVDPSGVEIMRLVRTVANLYDARVDRALRETGLSGPRWGLLLRMVAEERRGRAGGPAKLAGPDPLALSGGLSPTYLSRCQNVSKNTISSLIGGLEEQGLVEREVDRDDKRGFRIHLTEAGRTLVCESAPGHVTEMNALAGGLTAGEREQLIKLLEKLHHSLQQHVTPKA